MKASEVPGTFPGEFYVLHLIFADGNLGSSVGNQWGMIPFV